MANILTQDRIAYQIDRIYEEPEPEFIRSNAPVTRVKWSCENLPAGLTLSTSGQLFGRPTATGSYDCDISVETNFGSDTKTINITVKE